MTKLLTIAKREIANFFNQPVGYVFFVAFIAISYFLFFRQIFLSGYASIRLYILNIPILLAVIIPALTMGSIATEKSNKTAETIYTSPISLFDFVLGKFLGNLAIYSLMIATTLSIPLSLSFFGAFDWGIIVTSYLGILLLGAFFIAIGVFISATTDNQIVSFIVSLVAVLLLVLLGSDSVTMGLPPFISSIVAYFGVFSRLGSFNKGVLDLRDVLYFASFSLLFLVLTYYLLAEGRTVKKGVLAYTFKTFTIFLFVGVVALNIIVKPIFLRLDLTHDKVYTLSTTSKEILKKLDGTISLVFYYSKDLPPEFSERKDALMDLLKDFSKVPGNKLKVEYKEVVGADAEKLAQDDGITPVQFNTVKNDEFQAKRGVLGIVAKNAENKEPIAFLESVEGLEYQVISLVRRVSGGSNKKVAFISDSKSLALYTDLSTFRSELSKYYQATTLSLVKEKTDKEEKTIPSDTDVVVLAGPKENLDAGTIDKLKKFVESGKSLIIFADSNDISLQTLAPLENKTNINDLISTYGVTLNKGIVYDLKSNVGVNLNQGFFSYVLPYPYFAKAEVTPDGKKILGNVPQVLSLWASDLSTTSVDGVKQTVVVKTSQYAGFDEEANANLLPSKEFSQTNLKTRNIATISETANGANVIVVANDDMLLNDYFGADSTFILNLFDLATNDKGFVAIRSKSSIPNPLVFKDESVKNVVKYGNLIAIPLLIALFGLVRLKIRSQNFTRTYHAN